ncbi:MAG: AraC family transcriptional regulator [bacterium]|nr:AraC family transcriptional regulator [bacterium]
MSTTKLDYRKRISAAMNFISANLDRDLSLDEIAAEAAFSKFHFHRIFRIVVGETVAAYTKRLRLEFAANRLLADDRDDITTIAHECGFSSSQNFARAFKQRFDITPTEFRESKQGHKVSKDRNAASLAARYRAGDLTTTILDPARRDAMNATVKEMPEHHVAYVRRLGPYGKETCGAAFGALMQWAGPRGFAATGTMLGVYWDNPEITPPEKCRVDACITVPEGTQPEGEVALQTIAGGPYAVCGFEIVGDSFQQAWEDAFGWLIENGQACADSPCYELYHNDGSRDPDGRWELDICIPLKR